jgi:septal ring factor EnvC (AmiA/AmiB activator)
MRRVYFTVVLLMACATLLGADDVKPEDLRRLYDDTKRELSIAQDRKAELATENARLTARVAELEKQLKEQTVQCDDARRQAAALARSTYFLRTHYAAWVQFLQFYPMIRLQWDLFLDRVPPLSPELEMPPMDPRWPRGNDE